MSNYSIGKLLPI